MEPLLICSNRAKRNLAGRLYSDHRLLLEIMAIGLSRFGEVTQFEKWNSVFHLANTR